MGLVETPDVKDSLIVFLDAASDGNIKTITEEYKKIHSEADKKSMLVFKDGDDNMAIHFAAKIGNVRICKFILDEATKLGIQKQLVTSQNKKGFTPLI